MFPFTTVSYVSFLKDSSINNLYALLSSILTDKVVTPSQPATFNLYTLLDILYILQNCTLCHIAS